jgi:D-alanyl-lipoteichoic acid acyltransferase DltB (MBOAT superfamily)
MRPRWLRRASYMRLGEWRTDMTATVLLIIAAILFAAAAWGAPRVVGIDYVASGLLCGALAALAVRLGLP